MFGGEGGRAVGRMLNWWGDGVIGGMFPLIIADIPLNLKPDDAAYFRRTREARFKRPLEEIMASRDQAVEGFRKSLDPLRLTLKTQAFLGGAARELCGLYRVRRVPVGAGGQPVQAARREDDPVYAWRERLLDAFDGLARNRRAITRNVTGRHRPAAGARSRH